MSKCTKKTRRRKPAYRPAKPTPDFPLTPLSTGTWAKKIGGKLFYFGRWGRRINGKLEMMPGDSWWQEALDLYRAAAANGFRPTPTKKTDFTLGEVCNSFLSAKKQRADVGRLTNGSYADYVRVTDLLVGQFGKDRLIDSLTPADFEKLMGVIMRRWGIIRQATNVVRIRTVFKYAFSNGLIVNNPQAMFGSEFRKPAKSEMRKHKAKNGKKLLSRDECRRLLDALDGKEVPNGKTDETTGQPQTVTLEANAQVKAMVLLGLNAGFGNNDCATLPIDAVDLKGGWINYARPKTGIERRCKLWPETIEALKAVLAERPTPRASAKGLVFVTPSGLPWMNQQVAVRVGRAISRAMKAVGIHRRGLGGYTARHVFRTVADGAKDFPSIRLVMGHADASIDAVYREKIDDGRLVAVSEFVHDWLYGKSQSQGDLVTNAASVVVVEFDSEDGRVQKRFDDPAEAQRFCDEKAKAGKNPQAVGGDR